MQYLKFQMLRAQSFPSLHIPWLLIHQRNNLWQNLSNKERSHLPPAEVHYSGGTDSQIEV